MNSDNYNLDWAMRVLGVNLNMTAKEITQQYHNLCRTHHTDIPDNSSARSDAKMKDINIAYKIVTEYLKQNPGRQQSKSNSYHDNGETEQKDIFETIQSIIAEKLGIEPSEITMNTVYSQDIGADSLDIIEIIMEVGKVFNISIPYEDQEKVIRVGDLVMLVCKAKGIKCNSYTPNNEYNHSNEQHTSATSENDELWTEYEKAKAEYESAMALYESAMDCYEASYSTRMSIGFKKACKNFDSAETLYELARNNMDIPNMIKHMKAKAYWTRQKAHHLRNSCNSPIVNISTKIFSRLINWENIR